MKENIKILCPGCNSEETVAIGFGENLTEYYHCEVCGHDFIFNWSKILTKTPENENELFSKLKHSKNAV